jgi:TRAP-type C4-dicarboxylate transport system substrate-binding protein
MRALGLALSLVAATAHAETTLKIATLAPEGSSWMRLFHEWQRAVEARTDGRVKIKFYAGGVQGDERDVLRKIRLGQIAGAAVTGIGLAAIAPEVRALEIARTYEELDGLRAALGDTLRARFEERGFVLLGWGDVGPVHLFSQKPIGSFADLRQARLWQWSDDPTTARLFAALEMRGVPLGVPDVLPALATGTIDAFFGSPLSTLALQWGAHARYVTSMVMSQATGATVIAKRAWDAIAPADRQALLDEARTLERHVVEVVRADNAKAMAELRARGLQVVPTPPELQRELERRGAQVAEQAGAQLSADFQRQVRALVDGYRARAHLGGADRATLSEEPRPQGARSEHIR